MANCRLTGLTKRMQVRLALLRGVQTLLMIALCAVCGCSLPWAKKDAADEKPSAASAHNEKSPNQYIPAEFLK